LARRGDALTEPRAGRPPRSTDAPWYRRAFGPLYPSLYAHRDAAEAERALRIALPSLPAGPTLDLACGAGRYLRALRRAGRRAFGLDLSLPLLRAARAETPPAPVVQADMRALPFRDGAFASVLSMFSSFGYFEDEEDDRATLADVPRVLRPGGAFLLDLSNRARVVAGPLSGAQREVEGLRVVETRRLAQDRRVVEKEVRVTDRSGATVEQYTERLRLYEREEIEALARPLSLVVRIAWGGYDGSAFDSRAARMILLLEKRGGDTQMGGES
jgi:SAM-dependent methyltransferase